MKENGPLTVLPGWVATFEEAGRVPLVGTGLMIRRPSCNAATRTPLEYNRRYGRATHSTSPSSRQNRSSGTNPGR